MIPPFADHPLVKEYNIIKRFFRRHETVLTRSRISEFRRYAKIIDDAGLPVAFDFLGSVNFGQAIQSSDVDIVIYIRCMENPEEECEVSGCYELRRVENLILKSLVYEFAGEHPYEVQVIDCIDLNRLEREIEKGDPDSPLLIRFAFYRSLCRPVNPRLIRPLQRKLEQSPGLIQQMEGNLDLIFDALGHSSTHVNSIRKYQERVRDLGGIIPDEIVSRIHQHLKLGQEMMNRENERSRGESEWT